MSNNVFIHEVCNNPLLLDLNSSIHFLGIPFISENSVQVQSIVVRTINTKPNFYCTNCKSIVKPEEVLITCGQCKETFNLYGEKGKINELYIAPYGGLVCKNCVNNYKLDGVVKLDKLNLENR